MFVRDALDIRSRHVAFLCSFHEPAQIFEQISLIYALPRLFIGSFTVVLPFFPTGTLERVRRLLPSMPDRCWRMFCAPQCTHSRCKLLVDSTACCVIVG